MVEIQGPVVDEINREFQVAWGRAGLFGDFSYLSSWRRPTDNQHLEGYPVRLIYTKPGQHEIYDLQREAIRRSKRYIYIENAYFTDDALLKELILARRRHIDYCATEAFTTSPHGILEQLQSGQQNQRVTAKCIAAILVSSIPFPGVAARWWIRFCYQPEGVHDRDEWRADSETAPLCKYEWALRASRILRGLCH